MLVAEKRQHPVPEAAFKVGESSVEIGAHYFQKRARPRAAPARAEQLEKLGLRYFFPHGDNRDLARRVELGPPRFPPVPSFQLDRGRFENYLLRIVREHGADVLDGCARPRRSSSSSGGHRVTSCRARRTRATVTTRWVVDASGRAGLLKRQLGLARPSTHARQRLLVPGHDARARRRLVRRPGLAGARAVRRSAGSAPIT